MQCHDIQNLLGAYLDQAVSPAEHTLIQQHLNDCPACQNELAALSQLHTLTRQTLHDQAAQAIPSALAWDRLQSRLTQESTLTTRRLFPRLINLFVNPFFQRGSIMRFAFILSSLVITVTLAATGLIWSPDTPAVSAQQILAQAYSSQLAQQENQGIHHLRTESYNDFSTQAGVAGALGEYRYITESYFDPEAKKFRSVTTNANTEQVEGINAYDGTYIYNHDLSEGAVITVPLTVYRSTQGAEAMASALPDEIIPPAGQAAFETARQDPNTELLGEETWLDGSRVYVLRTQQVGDVAQKFGERFSPGFITLYFDTETYLLRETSMTLMLDDEEKLVHYTRVWADEFLPANTPIQWDLSDVAGIVIVEDETGEHIDRLPELITEVALVERFGEVYLLDAIPEGFELEMRATVERTSDPGVYLIDYRNAQGHYFFYQGPADAPESLLSEAEKYETASGLTLYFLVDRTAPADQMFTTAIVVTPDGTQFDLSSNLPLDRVKALADSLILIG